jgi:DNA mismatch repair protein MutS
MSLIETYYSHTQKYKSIYGEKTVVLMQVGSFYEVYGRVSQDVNNNKIITCSEIEDVSNICGLNIANKGDNNIMLGFSIKNEYILNKYIQKLQKAYYTVVVYKQNDECPSAERELLGIFTPGTTFTDDNDIITNNIMCIRILNILANKLNNKETIVFGMSSIDVLSGNCNLTEYNQTFLHIPSTYDELEKYYNSHNPNELIILYNSELFNREKIIDILHFISSTSNKIRYVDLDEKEKKIYEGTNQHSSYSNLCSLSKRANNCEKQVYQLELLKQFYKGDMDINKEVEDLINTFNLYETATHSFTFLLDYCYSINPDIVKNIKLPILYNEDEKLLLANHSLKQLNFLETNVEQNIYGTSKKLQSVIGFLNNCKTSMGKRKMKEILLNPITNINELNKLYDDIEYTLRNKDEFQNIYNQLKSIKDLEKIYRKIVLKNINPDDIFDLFNNIKLINNIYEDLSIHNKYFEESTKNTFKNIYNSLSIIYNHFKLILNDKLEITTSYNDFNINFFNKKIYNDLDEKDIMRIECNDMITALLLYLDDLIKKQENKSKKDPYCSLQLIDNMLKIKLTDKRLGILLSSIKKMGNTKVNINYKSSYDNNIKTFTIDLKYISKESRRSSVYIKSEEVEDLLHSLKMINNSFSELLKKYYNEFITELSSLKEYFVDIIDYIVFLDITITKAFNASKYNYCRPTIDEKSKSAFVDAKQLRHILIEQLQTNESYIPNDICLGGTGKYTITEEQSETKQNGILLYGTNAVGKSSLIKSLGISVILAQCGMYVPCSEFVYKPYSSIFTRILGNDNIFKGLSTFQVEMSELRTILKLADENSLVLGDELCSGTEIGSALSIFSAGVIQLHNRKTKFLFATHFHEMNNIDEITDLENMRMKHMSVHYDSSKNKLVYDRILRDGPGNNQYGLEVCKSLNLPVDFLDLAYELRTKILKNEKSIAMFKQSKYNSKKLLGLCELCGKHADEIHHIKQQKDANEFGIVDGIHKNHLSNLMSLCEKCHDKIHS